MEPVKLYVKGLSYSQTQTGAYALVLAEEKGDKRLPIIIGGFEAQSIAIALKKDMNPPRPLTHDLFKSFAEQFAISLKEVIIHKLEDGVFFSILVCVREGEEQVLDARTSDAVALAIRFGTPIYTYREILDEAGVLLQDSGEGMEETGEPTSTAGSEQEFASPEESPRKGKAMPNLASQSLSQLNQLLDEAVKEEDYEKAARIRDEIDRRQS
ncbi:MAG: bifunctional nuclease family protein [Schleiferiaceae bacterium]|jgi:bifunctional DNase/RNase|nr:bifunctional nuclease family protein [Schleiferiaceae bacterium]MDR9442131.1 bifunctional nuclease family protein [Schleiferiaceae bacterium]